MSGSWVLQEVNKVITLFDKGDISQVTFEVGYGPSGYPHIGTFGEVFRTSLVINALKHFRPDVKVRFICFSDDMDGLRKVPDNVDNRDMVAQYLGFPLTSIPDPTGGDSLSYGQHMNNTLLGLINRFGFNCEFISATEYYKGGGFNDAIKKILKNYDAIKALVLPMLGEQRQRTYHPIMPVCKKTGKVLMTEITAFDAESGDITYVAEDGDLIQSNALNGGVKMQWRIDWGMRWYQFGVNYEMHGKDVAPSAEVADQVCTLLGCSPPIRYVYEMFLDGDGKKISKSKGNGVTLEQWLRYAPPCTLCLFMYYHPHRAKSLTLDLIPKVVDEYIKYSSSYSNNNEDKLNNPLWHIHQGNPPDLGDFTVGFSLMLNLARACSPDKPEALASFIKRSGTGGLTEFGLEFMNDLIERAFLYYSEVLLPKNVEFGLPDDLSGLMLLCELLAMPQDDYQEVVVLAGERSGYSRSQMKPWFQMIYQVLFGSESGPRLGTFISIYGADKTRNLILKRINREGDL